MGIKNSVPLLLVAALLTAQFTTGHCEKWWRIVAKGDAVLNANNTELPVDQNCANPTIFSDILNSNQMKLCQHDRDNKLLSTIAIGVLRAIHECQKLFKYRPWNCSVFDSGPYLGKFVERGTPETAFLNAMISAGIAREVARKCKDQSLEWCTCDLSVPSDQRKWDGATIIPACGDNYNYGVQLAEQFTDTELDNDSCTGQTALHNNKVGRKVVNDTKLVCICHGFSGSCTVITCYKKVPDIEEIGEQLLVKYDDAERVEEGNDNSELMLNKTSMLGSSKLAYCKASPNFCQPNLKNGIYGTSGRQCWPERNDSTSCSNMCCGGPVDQKQVIKDEQQCEFVWCCSVKCRVVGNYTVTNYYCK